MRPKPRGDSMHSQLPWCPRPCPETDARGKPEALQQRPCRPVVETDFLSSMTRWAETQVSRAVTVSMLLYRVVWTAASSWKFFLPWALAQGFFSSILCFFEWVEIPTTCVPGGCLWSDPWPGATSTSRMEFLVEASPTTDLGRMGLLGAQPVS